MGELGLIHQLIIPIGGYQITLNLEVMAMTWIVILMLLFLGFWPPAKKQWSPKLFK